MQVDAEPKFKSKAQVSFGKFSPHQTRSFCELTIIYDRYSLFSDV